MTKNTVSLSSSVCVLYFFQWYYVYITDIYFKILKFSGFWIMEKSREGDQISQNSFRRNAYKLGNSIIPRGKKVARFIVVNVE